MSFFVSEYGDKENLDLAEKYHITKEQFPAYRLFLKGTTGEPVAYTGETTNADAIKNFVTQQSGSCDILPAHYYSRDQSGLDI